jgi:hypothetical protein
MFDVVSGEDGSGIFYECSIEDDGIPTEIFEGDIVELFIDGDNIFAEATEVDGRNVYGIVSEIPFSSRDCGIEEGVEISFQLRNVSRCIHQ